MLFALPLLSFQNLCVPEIEELSGVLFSHAFLVHWVNARTTLALVLPHTARLMDYIAAWWVACQLRPAQLAGSRHTFI